MSPPTGNPCGDALGSHESRRLRWETEEGRSLLDDSQIAWEAAPERAGDEDGQPADATQCSPLGGGSELEAGKACLEMT